MARIEATVEEANVALLRVRAADTAGSAAQAARLRLAEARMERARQLHERGSVSSDALDEIAAELAISHAEFERSETVRRIAAMELARSEAELALYTVRSPISGIVTERLAIAGEQANVNRHIVEIAALDPLHVEVFPPVELFPRLRIGQKATVEPSILGVAPFEATIAIIDRVFDASSNTFGVRLRLDNSDGVIPAGLRCTVVFDVGD